MKYRLWLNDLECRVAADQHAINWLGAMQKRYPDNRVRIEPAPDADVTFPVGEEDRGEKIAIRHMSLLSAVHIAIR